MAYAAFPCAGFPWFEDFSSENVGRRCLFMAKSGYFRLFFDYVSAISGQ
jgi:hypothetical protein